MNHASRFLPLAVLLPLVAFAGPKLQVVPEVYDLGRLPAGDTPVPFEFVIKNVGDEELKITNVRAYCGCTTTELAANTLAPNEEVVLRGELKTRGIEGATSKSIAISSNDPHASPKIIKIVARLPYSQAGLRIAPRGGRTFAYRMVNNKVVQLRAALRIENCDPQNAAEITAIDLPEGWQTTAALPIAVPPEASERIDIIKPLDDEPDSFDNLPIVIHTNHPESPILNGTIVYRTVTLPPTSANQTPAEQTAIDAIREQARKNLAERRQQQQSTTPQIPVAETANPKPEPAATQETPPAEP